MLNVIEENSLSHLSELVLHVYVHVEKVSSLQFCGLQISTGDAGNFTHHCCTLPSPLLFVKITFCHFYSHNIVSPSHTQRDSFGKRRAITNSLRTTPTHKTPASPHCAVGEQQSITSELKIDKGQHTTRKKNEGKRDDAFE